MTWKELKRQAEMMAVPDDAELIIILHTFPYKMQDALELKYSIEPRESPVLKLFAN